MERGAPWTQEVGVRRVGARRVGLEGWGAQNFALFFFPLPPQNSFFSSLSEGLLVEFWWCLKRRGAQICTLGVLGLLCEAPAAPNPPVSNSECVPDLQTLNGSHVCVEDLGWHARNPRCHESEWSPTWSTHL